MTAGWKQDDLGVGHVGGDIFRPSGGAEPIIFGADRQDWAGDLLERIRLVRGRSLNIEVHAGQAQTDRKKVVENLLHSRLLGQVRGAQNGGIRAQHHTGHAATHDWHQFKGCPGEEIGFGHRADDGATMDGRPYRQIIGGAEQNQRPAAFRVTNSELGVPLISVQ
jgi:hypothetical protein